jgi:AcrR family transcriptional regulator
MRTLPAGATFVEQTRVRLRTTTLDALLAAVTSGASTSMSAIAAAVGVSRQTIYHEFGSRDGLFVALVARENDTILALVTDALERHPGNLPAGVAESVEALLTRSARDALTKALLGGDPDLLPLYTTRAEPLLEHSGTALRAYGRARFPEIDPDELDLLVGVVVRLAHSHIVVPHDPPEVVAAQIARLVARLAPAADPHGGPR